MPRAAAPDIARLLALAGELTPPAPGGPRRKYDLAHMRTLLDELRNPHRRFPAVLIAGTNGKGSTAATLASILKAAGHRIGLYTSPHLEIPNERIRINGDTIADEALGACFLVVEAASIRLVASGLLPYPPSFFETMTAIAFLHFAGGQPAITKQLTASQFASHDSTIGNRSQAPTRPVDIAILEVGLGGRLDATNVVDPLLSVLTDISLDHTQWLGSTIAEITREKAGILRPNGTLITLPQHPQANQVIGEIAVPLGAAAISAADYLPPRSAAGHEPSRSLSEALRNRYSAAIPALSDMNDGSNHEVNIVQVDSPLAGTHQQRNLALALASAVTLHRLHGFALTPDAIEKGIRNTVWPGRLQLLAPPPSRVVYAPLLLDAAHNAAGAWALRAVLSTLPIEGPRRLIFACMADKSIDEIAQVLFPVFDEVLLTWIDSPRAAPVERLLMAVERTGTPHRSFSTPSSALEAAQASTPASGLITVAGSISLLGAVSALLPDWG